MSLLPATVLVPVASTVVAIALPAMLADLDLGTTAIWWLVTGYLLVVAALQVPSGWLGDRLGARRTLLGATGLLALASLGVALAPGARLVVAARLGQGVAAAAIIPAGFAALRRRLAGAERDRAVGVFTAALAGGGVVGVAGGGLLVSIGGWRVAFAAIAVAALAALVPVGLTPGAPRAARPTGDSQRATPGPASAAGSGWQRPAARIAVASLAFYVVLLVVPLRLDGTGHTSGTAGALLGVFALGAALGALVTAPLSRRMQPAHARRLLTAVAVVALVVLALTPVTPWVLGPLLACAGVALGALLTGGFARGLGAAGHDRAGAMSGRLSLARYAGSILGTAALPPVLAAAGTTGGLAFAAVTLLLLPVGAAGTGERRLSKRTCPPHHGH